MKCECEHTAHTEGTKTPNGNFGHKYGTNFFPTNLTKIKTLYGTFTVCKDCLEDCNKDIKHKD